MELTVSRRRERERRATRAAFARLMALASLLAVFASFAVGGHRYFYCAWMDRSSETSCCAPRADAPDVPAVDELDDDCCEVRSVAALAPGLGDVPVEGWPAPAARELTLVVPSALDAPTDTRSEGGHTFATPIRAGPGSPEGRALLQVYLS